MLNAEKGNIINIELKIVNTGEIEDEERSKRKIKMV